ncbi:MAG: DUF1840 domain-containing protein [Gammaproteobacteria bacterium]|jgi:hypothetical protein|nr:DUF1840 domain-containing protein [Gammaproteobacteria bacterium]
MPVTFTTKAYADITMLREDALTLLKMMGHSGTVPSAIVSKDIPAALNRLTTAIGSENTSPPVEDEDEPAVGITTRAQPLINLLTAAVQENANVMWK